MAFGLDEYGTDAGAAVPSPVGYTEITVGPDGVPVVAARASAPAADHPRVRGRPADRRRRPRRDPHRPERAVHRTGARRRPAPDRTGGGSHERSGATRLPAVGRPRRHARHGPPIEPGTPPCQPDLDERRGVRQRHRPGVGHGPGDGTRRCDGARPATGHPHRPGARHPLLRVQLPRARRVRRAGAAVAVHARLGRRRTPAARGCASSSSQVGPGVRLDPPGTGPLPVLRIGPPARPEVELPDLADSWAWAHAQVAPTGRAARRSPRRSAATPPATCHASCAAGCSPSRPTTSPASCRRSRRADGPGWATTQPARRARPGRWHPTWRRSSCPCTTTGGSPPARRRLPVAGARHPRPPGARHVRFSADRSLDRRARPGRHRRRPGPSRRRAAGARRGTRRVVRSGAAGPVRRRADRRAQHA